MPGAAATRTLTKNKEENLEFFGLSFKFLGWTFCQGGCLGRLTYQIELTPLHQYPAE
jgi:hypothetical protein